MQICGGRDGDGHLLEECTFQPVVHVRELLEFMLLMARDRSNWPRCSLRHGWLPGLSTAGERDPWAACLDQLADRSLERVVGAYPLDEAGFWTPPDFWGPDDLAREIGEHPCLWTDGSLEPCPTAGFAVAGAGVYFPAPELAVQGAIWEGI